MPFHVRRLYLSRCIFNQSSASAMFAAVSTLMQLLLNGVISSDHTRAVALEIEGHVSGSFRVEWVRVLDGHDYGQPVAIRFLKAAQ